jgi:hypothetical protein
LCTFCDTKVIVKNRKLQAGFQNDLCHLYAFLQLKSYCEKQKLRVNSFKSSFNEDSKMGSATCVPFVVKSYYEKTEKYNFCEVL